MSLNGANPETHPLAADIDRVRFAFDMGFGDEFEWLAQLDGLETMYIPPEDTDDGCSYLGILDRIVGRKLEYYFAPSPEHPNPMTVTCTDEGEESVTPVLARVILELHKPPLLKIGVRDGIPITARSIQVDVTDDATVFVPDEATQIPPLHGTYDGDLYQFAYGKAHTDMRLGMVLGFANIFLGN
jgi:hypothetical protein